MKNIFKFTALIFVFCGILFPSILIIADKILPSSYDNVIYIDDEVKGSEILNQDFASDKYFHTNNLRPYITLDEANLQKEVVMQANDIDQKTIDQLIKDNTYNNLFFDYVNITPLNLSIYQLNK